MVITKTRTPACRSPNLFLSLALALSALTSVAAPRIDPGFKGNGICQFISVHYNLTPRTEASINNVVSKSLKQHQDVFGFIPRPGFKVRIRIFGQYKTYEAFTLKDRTSRYIAQHAGSVTNLSGYFSRHTGEVVTWRQRHPGYLANNILHEASHAIMLGHYRRVPVWISEGCATYFSFPTFMQDARDIGTLKYRWAKLNLWLRHGKLPETEPFLNLSHEQWRRQNLPMAYTVSWSLSNTS